MNEENHLRHFLKFFIAFLIIIGFVLSVYFFRDSYQKKAPADSPPIIIE